MVYAVDLVRCETASVGSHGSGVHLLKERKHPHSLIRLRTDSRDCKNGESAKEFFHDYMVLFFVTYKDKYFSATFANIRIDPQFFKNEVFGNHSGV